MKLDVKNKTIDKKIKLYNGDCLEILKYISDKSVDLVIIDPPYDFMTKHKSNNYSGAGAFGKMGRKYHSELENNNIIKGLDTEKVLNELSRIMKNTNIYIWCNKEQIPIYLEYFKGKNYELLTWHKTNPVPTCNNKYLSDTEYLLFFRENGIKIYGTYETKKKYYVTPTNKEDKNLYNHPTIKPLNIIENLIINSSKENDTVLDCFMGSGTTGVACKKLNRNFIGIELNEKYFEIAKKRIEEKNNQATIFDYIDNNAIKENEVI